MKLRPAVEIDLETILRFRREAAEWLATRGSDQWRHPYPTLEGMVARIAASIDAGETWMVDDDQGDTLATITINTRSDEGLWTSNELRTALFLHRMILDRSAAGRGIGAELIDFAAEQAEEVGREWLRLDCWTTNYDLQQYYRRRGFRHVRTVPNHYSGSAACFERPASYRSVSAS